MRDILFRGKRKDNREWVYGYVYRIWERVYILWGMTNDVPNMIEVDPETVGQYTGLTDKNGKKIFEGDIVEHHVQGDILVNRGVIVWDERNGCWLHQLNTMRPTLYMFNSKAWKIIGNIHDNPELLQKMEG